MADPHGPGRLVNLYAAMASLHVAWATWSAVAVITATRSRWRHLAWLYPAATTVVVLATANHFALDAAAGLAVTALGLLATRATTRPDATELTAVIVYRVAGYWAPGAAGAVTAALLTRRHPAQAARPVTPLRPQAPPPPAPGQLPGIKPARAHPRACPASRTPQRAKGHTASARSPPGPGVTGPAARHGCGPAPLPGSSRTSRRDSHRPPTERRKERNMS